MQQLLLKPVDNVKLLKSHEVASYFSAEVTDCNLEVT